MLRSLIVIGVLSAATGALADPVPLANDELKQAVSGSTVEIDTPLGTTVPMRFGADGLVAAEAGVLAPVLGSSKDRGRWWVEGEKLCTKWFRWFDAQARCLTISRDGNRISWRKIDDGETGTGTIVVSADKPKDAPAKAPAVVAKADAAPAKKAASPVRPQEIAAAETSPVVHVAAGEPVEAASSVAEPAPSVVAQVEGPQTPAPEGPTMRFGGAGLLDATGLGGLTTAAAAAPAPASAAVPPAPVTAPRQDLEAAKPKPNKTAQAAKPAKKGTAVAKLPSATEGAPAGTRIQQQPPGGARERTIGTGSTRAVSLYKVTGVRPYDVLNVRRGPSEQHNTVAAIPPTGRRVEITGQCQSDWCPIRYGNVKGWVNRYYLSEEGSLQDSASPVYMAKPY